ncbi:MAG TPA: hypothetical protein VFV73_40970 [Streptosporangiaceae bacterium]|nr:hypothetical protein [Streptosporangiaceae bacterium]
MKPGGPFPFSWPAGQRELYVNLLLVSRRHGGQGIGAALIGPWPGMLLAMRLPDSDLG